jgi:hypothetical protein
MHEFWAVDCFCRLFDRPKLCYENGGKGLRFEVNTRWNSELDAEAAFVLNIFFLIHMM